MQYPWLLPYLNDVVSFDNKTGKVIGLKNTNLGNIYEVREENSNSLHYLHDEDLVVIKPVYFNLNLNCNGKSEIYICDEENNLVQNGANPLKTALRPGIYYVHRGFHGKPQTVKLYKDITIFVE